MAYVRCKACKRWVDLVGASRLKDGTGHHCCSCRIDLQAGEEFARLWPGGLAEAPPEVEVMRTGGWCLALGAGWRMLTLEDEAPDQWLVCDYEATGWGYEGEPVVVYEGPDAAAARAALLGNPRG